MPKINLNITDLETEKQELTDFLSRPDAYNDPAFGSKNRRLSELEELITAGSQPNYTVCTFVGAKPTALRPSR